MASSGAMMALTFLFTIPQFLATGTAPGEEDLLRAAKRRFEGGEVSVVAESARSGRVNGPSHVSGERHCVNGAYSISLAPLDKLWDGWVPRPRRRRRPPTQPTRRDRRRCCVLTHKTNQWNWNISLTLRRCPRRCPRRRLRR